MNVMAHWIVLLAISISMRYNRMVPWKIYATFFVFVLFDNGIDFIGGIVKKKRLNVSIQPLCTRSRGRTGTILLSLVFETSASTNSAIRARCALFKCDAKVALCLKIKNFSTVFLSFCINFFCDAGIHHQCHCCNNPNYSIIVPNVVGLGICSCPLSLCYCFG